MPTRVEPISQGQTQDIAGTSSSQTPMAPLEVPTSVAPAVTTPTVFTVPLGVPLAYPIPAPAEPAVYPVSPPHGPTVYPAPAAPVPPLPTVYPAAPAPAVPVAPHSVPPTRHPVAATYADPGVPPEAYAPVYAAALGVPPTVYLAVPPVAPALVFSHVSAAIPTHLPYIVAAQARIPALAVGLIGRLSNTPNVAFTYEVNGVVDYLTSHGVIALPGRRYNTRQLQGLNWVVCPTNRIIPLQPREVSSDNSIDGRLSISFSNYQATPSTRETIYNRNDDEAPSDEEELRLHTIAVLIEERRLLVRRLYPSVALPRRATSGAAGYDLPINRAQDVPVNSRALLTTGLSIKVPDGTYARIVAQSRAALKRGILIGVGVVDFDFRGEVKILAFNITDQHIFLQKNECIAQIILENISTPEVYEVESLDNTVRDTNAFGSTS
ncbi:cell wall adhesin EAP1-like [Zingiber officinale]|uniref:cell wall adhesin EAP1-like n=1 Tax=Zingiber officinale TaxID=94328 RepID=UPI001C4C3EED|nr:cell wall adhesin EAP1-like [Zingiber officinale]